MERPGCQRDAERVEDRMEYATLVGAGRNAADPESSGRIGDDTLVHAFDDHVGELQVSAVQAVEHDTRDLRFAGFRGRGRSTSLLLRDEPAAGGGEREGSN